MLFGLHMEQGRTVNVSIPWWDYPHGEKKGVLLLLLLKIWIYFQKSWK